MATFQELFQPSINDIPVIQYGESVLSAGNKEATYENPFGQNIVEDLGGGQQTLVMQFRALNQSDINRLTNLVQNDRVVNVVDKHKGEYRAEIKSYEIKDSETHIGETRYRITFKIVEQIEQPTQNIVSQIAQQRDEILESVNFPVKADDRFILDELRDNVNNITNEINEVVSFANSTTQRVATYVEALENLRTAVDVAVFTPSVLATQFRNLARRLGEVFQNKRDQINSVKTASVAPIAPVNSTSNIENDRTTNANVVNEQQNRINLYLLLDGIVQQVPRDTEEATANQEELIKRLLAIDFTGNELTEIQNSVAQYYESLNLPTIQTRQVSSQPAIVLAYDLYEDTTRLQEFRDLNGTRNDDDLNGSIRVLSK